MDKEEIVAFVVENANSANDIGWIAGQLLIEGVRLSIKEKQIAREAALGVCPGFKELATGSIIRCELPANHAGRRHTGVYRGIRRMWSDDA